jgi:regulatory protein
VSQSDAAEKVRAAALRLLTQRPRSAHELSERLSRRFSSEAVDEVVSALANTSLLDDEAFAAWWTKSRTGSKPMAASMIARELAQKGVDAETVAGAIADVDDAANARALASKAARTLAKDDYDRFARRLSGRLARRGYGSGLTRSVVREAWSLMGRNGV